MNYSLYTSVAIWQLHLSTISHLLTLLSKQKEINLFVCIMKQKKYSLHDWLANSEWILLFS